MESLDTFILANAAFCFGIYLLGHMTVFRFINSTQIIQGLIKLFLATAALNGIVSGVFCYFFKSFAHSHTGGDILLACLVSFIILGMACFLYVIGIFGPYETSVRIRLIRELQKRNLQGVTLDDILQDYRDVLMVKERLKRLTGSGELLFQDGYYRIGKPLNIFSVIDSVTGVLRKIYGRPEANAS